MTAATPRERLASAPLVQVKEKVKPRHFANFPFRQVAIASIRILIMAVSNLSNNNSIEEIHILQTSLGLYSLGPYKLLKNLIMCALISFK